MITKKIKTPWGEKYVTMKYETCDHKYINIYIEDNPYPTTVIGRIKRFFSSEVDEWISFRKEFIYKKTRERFSIPEGCYVKQEAVYDTAVRLAIKGRMEQERVDLQISNHLKEVNDDYQEII